MPLSEQISSILTNVRLILVGTEKPLTTACTYLLLTTAEILKANNCSYCRLTYESDRLYLEAMLLSDHREVDTIFNKIIFVINNLGGKLQTNISDKKIIQIQLFLPYEDRSQPNINLSQREKEIVQLLAAGLRDREIAQKLYISDRTVKFHINNAVSKLNARTRIQAIHYAYTCGYLY